MPLGLEKEKENNVSLLEDPVASQEVDDGDVDRPVAFLDEEEEEDLAMKLFMTKMLLQNF